MTTKTREEAIKKANAEILKLVWNGNFSHMIDAESESMCKASEFRVYKSDTGDYKKFPFTPSKPEFEKGTIGLDEYTAICFYKKLNSTGDYLLCSHKKNVNGTGGYPASTFTPIYQADPVEKLAFELVCKEVQSTNWKCFPVVSIKEYILSKAKEELSK